MRLHLPHELFIVSHLSTCLHHTAHLHEVIADGLTVALARHQLCASLAHEWVECMLPILIDLTKSFLLNQPPKNKYLHNVLLGLSLVHSLLVEFLSTIESTTGGNLYLTLGLLGFLDVPTLLFHLRL